MTEPGFPSGLLAEPEAAPKALRSSPRTGYLQDRSTRSACERFRRMAITPAAISSSVKPIITTASEGRDGHAGKGGGAVTAPHVVKETWLLSRVCTAPDFSAGPGQSDRSVHRRDARLRENVPDHLTSEPKGRGGANPPLHAARVPAVGHQDVSGSGQRAAGFEHPHGVGMTKAFKVIARSTDGTREADRRPRQRQAAESVPLRSSPHG